MISRLSVLGYIKGIFFCCFFLLCTFGIFINYLLAEQKNPFNSALPAVSVSYIESSFAPLINPVFADISPSPLISYMMQNFENQNNCNHYFLMNLAGFIFSYSWIDNLYNYDNSSIEPSKAKLFTIGKGLFFGNIFGLGVNYSFSKSNKSDFNEYQSLSAGILFRPFNFLSLGYVSRDMNSPKIHEQDVIRTDIFSLSIRPLNNITFSADAAKYEGQKFNMSDMLFSTNLRLKYEISVFAALNKDKDVTFGLSIPIGLHYSRSTGLIVDGYSNINNSAIPDSYGFGVSVTGQRTRSSLIEPKRFLKIILNEPISEIKAESLFKQKEIIFYDLLNAVNTAAQDESITGIILQIDNSALGFAQIQEMRDQLKLFRNKNKKIYAILNVSGNKEYYLAAACDKIFFSPMNLFYITGLKAEIFFFKEGLDKLGIKFELVKKGTYKSFDEPYTREHMSPEYKENISGLLTDLNEQFITDIIKDRQIPREQIDELFKKGLLTPDDAVRAGFIDEIYYPIDAEKKIMESDKLTYFTINLEDYVHEKIRDYQWGAKPEIAIIYVSGSIIRGESIGYGNISPKTIGDLTYYDALNNAFRDSSVKAIIIRIDSGGGSAAASELMWHYLFRLKQKYKKPIIFSFGNIAASGGYYIACTGDRIFSDRGSITGSIGIVTGKLSLKELYKKLGINKDIIKMSEFADIFSEARDFTVEERKIIEKGVVYVYNRFTNKVSEARRIPKERIDKIAEGRVFTGAQAKSNGLIDDYGGLLAAVELAKKAAGIKHDYRVKHLPETAVPLLDILGLTSNSILSEKAVAFLQALELIEFNDEYALYYLPYKIVIE